MKLNMMAASIKKAKREVKWDARFEIGIGVVDEQHKCLVALCDNLLHTVETSDRRVQREELIKTLKDCVTYVSTHFTLEEDLMKKSNYPGLAEHKAQHIEFSKKLLDTSAEVERGTSTLPTKFATFLYDWILQHISFEDKKFAPCVKAYLENGGS